MHVTYKPIGLSKSDTYQSLNEQFAAVIDGETDSLANSANLSALIYELLPDLNWAGFYYFRGGELVLGPFQGKVACVRIPLGKGVCGTAAEQRQIVVVPDVHAFPGHIACDAASQSEIVLPLVHEERLLGVLDLDSPRLARFDQQDADGLNAAVTLLIRHSNWDWLTD